MLRLMQKPPFDIAPYKNVLIFAITLIAADLVWKLTIHGDEEGIGAVTWLGSDITPLFTIIVRHTAQSVYTLVDLIRDNIHLIGEDILRYDNGHGTRIVWGCTPLKQIFIFTCILLATPPYKSWHKVWFVPAGWVVIYGVNILRITIIALCIENHPDWFEVMHGYVLKYGFYGIIFLIWLLWTEVLTKEKG